jgi:hypothetical protein
MATDTAALLARHLPILRYDSQGSFLAGSAGIMTDRVSPDGRTANQLKRADGSVIATAGRGLDLDFLGWEKYGDGTGASRSDYLDVVGRDYVQQARQMHRPPYADVVYGRARGAGGGAWWLQYWLFYLYNNKAFLGFGLHEGDWEMVMVRLGTDRKPEAMAFAQHSHGQKIAWQHVQKKGERPIVYVARGSQASFPTPGRHDAPVIPDYADGKGPEVASPNLEIVTEEAPAWMAWPGRWGSTRARSKVESDAPRGPRHQDKWRDPWTFFEECDEIVPGRRALGPPPPAPPAPELDVRREGDRAVVAYRFPAAPEKPRPAFLVVTLDAPGDDLPPATETFPVEGASGEVQPSLPLEDGPYEVRASAADDAGNASPATVVRLA